MLDSIDLKKLEKKAFRATHQDGLLDICIGGVILSMSAMGYSNDSEAFPILRFGLLLAGVIVSQLVFWGGKKYFTTPRLGQVKFGPVRKRRAATMAIVMSGIVLLQVLLLVGQILLWNNPQLAISLGFSSVDRDRERLLVAIIGALFVGPSTFILFYFSDFVRGYYIAFLLALAVFSMIWFDQPLYLTIAAFVILIPGVILFIRFLRDHPLPPVEVRRD